MSLVEQLLTDGILTSDPDDESRVIFTVTYHIKKAAVEAGGFQAFGKEFGYEETIHPEEGESYPNPVSLYEFCKTVVRKYVTDVFRSSILKKASQDARAQAEAILSQVL